MTPQAILQEAQKTLEKRGEVYGGFQGSLNDIACLWNAYLGEQLTPRDVAMLMLLLKIARTDSSPDHIDNYIDIAGYAALAGGLNGVLKD